MNGGRHFYAVLLLGLVLPTVPVSAPAKFFPGPFSSNVGMTSISYTQDQDPHNKRDKRVAVDVSGEWKLTGTKREDPDPHELTLVLKQTADTFSGTLTTNNGQFDVKDGKVKDLQITFSIYMPKASTTAACSGSVDRDAFKATCKMSDSTIDLVGSRRK